MTVIEVYRTKYCNEFRYKEWTPLTNEDRFTGRCKYYDDGTVEKEVEHTEEYGVFRKKKMKLNAWYSTSEIRSYTVKNCRK